MLKIKKLWSKVICICLIFTVFAANAALSASASSDWIGYVNGNNVNIRTGPATSYTSLGQLSKVYVTINSSTVASNGAIWYNVTTTDGITGYMHGDYINIISTPSSDEAFEEQLEQFPESYRDALRTLHSIYPNWVFKADKLTMSFEEAVANEAVYDKKLVNMSSDGISWRSLGENIYDWESGTWKNFSGNWTAAAKQVVAYYMDPRNFLNANDIYMFMQQSYDAATQTEAGVERIVEGTFLANGYSDSSDTAYGGSYIKVIMEAARQSGVSPYVLASTIILEQGVNGTSDLISGTTSYGKYYNFFNYNASGSDVVGNGLAFAKAQGWTTRSASIIGGAKRYAANYIAVGQDTYFYKDFNIGENTTYALYTHQYAQSVYDAKSSASGIRSVYSSDYSGSLSFRIPVYTSIPEEITEKPEENDYLNNYYLTAADAVDMSPDFYMYTDEYTLTASGDKAIYVKAPSGATVTSEGSYALKAGENTVVITVRAQTGYTNSYKIKVNTLKDCTVTVTSTVPKGDVNGDGISDIKDLIRLKQHIAQADVQVIEDACLLDGITEVNAGDIVVMRKMILGI